MRRDEIAQQPVMRGNDVVGSINAVGVMQAVVDHRRFAA
jgi:predicted transcriptional regulator